MSGPWPWCPTSLKQITFLGMILYEQGDIVFLCTSLLVFTVDTELSPSQRCGPVERRCGIVFALVSFDTLRHLWGHYLHRSRFRFIHEFIRINLQTSKQTRQFRSEPVNGRTGPDRTRITCMHVTWRLFFPSR